MTIQYQGDKVRLRPLRHADLPLTLAWHNDPAVRDPMMGFRGPVTEAQEARWFEALAQDQRRAVFGVEALADAALVGYTQLNDLDWISRTANLGIAIGAAERRGQGLGAQALDLLIAYGAAALNLRKIYLRVLAENPARRLYARAGFVEEGCLRAHHYLEGRYHDVILMARFL
ncbi:GNAT family N-acetyltransferase [Myxococcota bacterium]|nr:GNAT family N-acetyltransferase [Myxococcota bacterium]MBU1430155.1 GNAT family N-acetyltransferase [Myxococcota bacterium]MBU1899404.1 GNAT family N-acetyltransferase [Myxococcota bacterium]